MTPLFWPYTYSEEQLQWLLRRGSQLHAFTCWAGASSDIAKFAEIKKAELHDQRATVYLINFDVPPRR